MLLNKVLISDLIPLEYNPRKISKKRFQRLQSSIKEHTQALEKWDSNDGFRFAGTVTVNRNGNRIVGGHRRIEALFALGQDWVHAEDITWVDLSPDSAEENALCISLNDEEASGRWEEEKRNELLGEIQKKTVDLYNKLDFSVLAKKVKDTLEDTSDEAQEELKAAKEKRAHLIDNVSFVVQEILNKHGDTIKNGFMLFTYKNRTHLIVQCDDDTYALTKMVAELLKRENEEINKFLTLALRLGIEHSSWENTEPAGYTPGELEEDEKD